MIRQPVTHPPMVVDPDVKLMHSLNQEGAALKIQPLIVQSGKAAQLILADPSKVVGGIFINPAVADINGISVVRFAHMYKPGVPIYLIYDGVLPYTEEQLKGLGIQSAISKPVTLSQLMGVISPKAQTFNAKSILETSNKNQDPLDSEITDADSKFIPIRSDNFLIGTVSYFDLYVRLANDRYIKILMVGDQFSIERVTSYLKKGVTHFYLRKENQEHYLTYCDKISTALVKGSKTSLDIKTSQVLNHGEEVLKFFRDQKISDVNIQHAAKFLNNVEKLIVSLQPAKYPVVKGFLSNIASYEHGAGVVMIASLLIPSLRMTSADPIETIGIAALLHDIGLHTLSLPSDEDETKMNDQEKEKFQNHPVVGAEILNTVRGLKPATVQAVLQHHERRNKKGFPFRVGAGSISLVSEVIGISDEFFKIIQKMKDDPKFDLDGALNSRIFPAFSNALVNDFKNTFSSVIKTPENVSS